MTLYLYQCEDGGGLVVGVDGAAPAFATCPACSKAAECQRCEGMQVANGVVPEVSGPLRTRGYGCAAGHRREVTFVEGSPPESLACDRCDGLLVSLTG